MSEEPAVPKPRNIAPELWAGIVIVVVCLGAVVGPKLYFHFRHERIVGKLAGRLSPEFGNGSDVGVLTELMATGWPEADAALRRYADQSDRTAYACGANGRMFLSLFWHRDPVPGDGVRGMHISGIEQCHLRCLTGKDGAEGRLSGIAAVRLRSRGEVFEMVFSLMAEEAKALGVPEGREWTAALAPAEAAELIGLRMKPWVPADFANGNDLRCARFLLRKASALPKEEPGAEGRR